jgi:pseudaminic acid cytidylyltransferase
MKNKPICIIPARGGSKRVKNKNIKNFLGKPLISYVIKIAKKSKIFSRVIVTTDNKKIAKISKSYGAEVPFLRKKELADDFTNTNEVLIDCIKQLKTYNTKYHFCLYPTAPLILKSDLINAFKKIKKTKGDQLIATCDYDYTPLRALTKRNNKYVKFFWSQFAKSRSQDLTKLFHDSGTFYIFKTKKILEEKKVLQRKTVSYHLKRLQSVDIDTKEDFEFATYLYRYLLSKKKNSKLFS